MKLSSEEISALKLYAGSHYKLINGCPRGDEPCDDTIIALIQAIDSAIAKSRLQSHLLLYRGVGGDAASAIRSTGLRKGMVISDAAFMSTSTDPGAAGLFARFPPGGLIMRIGAPAGTIALDMAPYSLYAHEREYLLPRNTKIRIVDYDSTELELECEVAIDV